jgi:hypothetical protein
MKSRRERLPGGDFIFIEDYKIDFSQRGGDAENGFGFRIADLKSNCFFFLHSDLLIF